MGGTLTVREKRCVHAFTELGTARTSAMELALSSAQFIGASLFGEDLRALLLGHLELVPRAPRGTRTFILIDRKLVGFLVVPVQSERQAGCTARVVPNGDAVLSDLQTTKGNRLVMASRRSYYRSIRLHGEVFAAYAEVFQHGNAREHRLCFYVSIRQARRLFGFHHGFGAAFADAHGEIV